MSDSEDEPIVCANCGQEESEDDPPYDAMPDGTYCCEDCWPSDCFYCDTCDTFSTLYESSAWVCDECGQRYCGECADTEESCPSCGHVKDVSTE
jgi:hypothetical protein